MCACVFIAYRPVFVWLAPGLALHATPAQKFIAITIEWRHIHVKTENICGCVVAGGQ